MKKFLICIMFLVVFTGGVCLVAGKNTNTANATTSNAEVNIDNTINEESLNSSEEFSYNVNSTSYTTSIVYNVLLFEFKDAPNYFTQKRIDYMNELFNDDDYTNKVYSVHEYFRDLSYGKVCIFANIYLYKDSRNKSYYDTKIKGYTEEHETFVNGLKNATICYNNYSATITGDLIIFSTEAPDSTSSRLWGHANVEHRFVSISDEEATAPIIVHEIMHNFGIRDMYISNDYEAQPAGDAEIMAQTHLGAVDTFLYNKAILGWIETSNYEDDKHTTIETITKDGVYTLYPTTDQGDNTKSYKFGIKQGDSKVYFMVEYRKKQKIGIDSSFFLKDGLIVYRVNENYKQKGNNNKTYATYETYAFRPVNNYYYYSNSERYIYNNEEFGNLADENYYLYYEDKQMCKCMISDITYNEDGTVSFYFQDLRNTSVVAGMVKYERRYLNDVAVYVNGVYQTVTTHRGYFVVKGILDNDVISFVDPYNRFHIAPITAKANSYSIAVEATPLPKQHNDGDKNGMGEQNSSQDTDKDIVQTITDACGDIYGGICDAIGGAADAIGDALGAAGEAISDFFSGLGWF